MFEFIVADVDSGAVDMDQNLESVKALSQCSEQCSQCGLCVSACDLLRDSGFDHGENTPSSSLKELTRPNCAT